MDLLCSEPICWRLRFLKFGDLELDVLWTWCFIGQNFLFYLPGEIYANPTFVTTAYAKVLNWFVIG